MESEEGAEVSNYTIEQFDAEYNKVAKAERLDFLLGLGLGFRGIRKPSSPKSGIIKEHSPAEPKITKSSKASKDAQKKKSHTKWYKAKQRAYKEYVIQKKMIGEEPLKINEWSKQVRPNGSKKRWGKGGKHGNRLDSSGPHDVYVIKDLKTGQIYHFGETGRGWRKRGAEWQRKLKKKYGVDTAIEPLKTNLPNKLSAKQLETRYIKAYEKIFKTKPYLIDKSGEKVLIQKNYH